MRLFFLQAAAAAPTGLRGLRGEYLQGLYGSMFPYSLRANSKLVLFEMNASCTWEGLHTR